MATRKRTRRSLGEVTKRDFVAIANILCTHKAPDALVHDMAVYFGGANPRFDYHQFVNHVEKCKAGTR